MRRLLAAIVLLGAAAFGPWTTAPAVAAPPNEGGWDRQWGMRLIGAEAAWDKGLMGEGVDIAVIDTGVHLAHQDFAGRVGAGYNFIEPGEPPQDDFRSSSGASGHGTHVAGIAAAGYGNGGVVGVAPMARIMPVKALNRDGGGSSRDVAAAMRWAADNGAEVINLSLGEFDKSLFGPSTQEAIRYVWDRGVIPVFSAGNDYVLPSGFEDEPALVVASVGPNDTKSYFSSDVGNARWAISAPGGAEGLTSPSEDRIFSTIWVDDSRTDTYGYMQGTSMAAPHVAGAAAVLRAAGLSHEETVLRLLSSAKDLGPEGPDSTYGHGRLDLARAVEGLGAPTGPAPAPPTTAAPVTTGAPAPPSQPSTPPRSPATSGAASPSTSASDTTTSGAAPSSTVGEPTDATVAIQTDDRGGGGGRPWLPIAAATLALGATVAGAAASRHRART
jgi:thermitase